MAEVFEVTRRDAFGSQHTRRLRRDGQIPAILYGHGKENVPLAVPQDQAQNAVRQSARLIDLQGAVKESALIREVQWDALGNQILHLDLTRVSATELVRVDVALETRGTALGATDGGVVKVLVHTLEIECRANSIPEKLELNINKLELHQSLTIADLELPEGAKTSLEPDTLLVQCVEATIESEEDETEEGVEGAEEGAAASEPEVIGRKDDDEEGGEAEESTDN
jgi:large subunit ribosomal protein L25